MKILIAGSVIGSEGYEEWALVKALENELKKEHEVDTFLLPFSRNFLTLPDQILAYRLLDVHSCDMLITVGYPACMLEHNNKISYLFDIVPHYWEYWDSEFGILCNNQYLNIRDMIHKIDTEVLSSAKKIVCNSQILSEDLSARIGIKAETLYCPILDYENNNIEKLTGEKYIMSETNLLPFQRPELLIQLMTKLKDIKLKVFIPDTDIVYKETFEKWILEDGLENKIKIIYSKASIEDYKNSLAYIVTDYKMRRISNGIIKGMGNGIPIIYMEDCGGSAELLNSYDNRKCVDINEYNLITDKLIFGLKRNKNAYRPNELGIFAERLILL